jgi:hypothetical protein
MTDVDPASLKSIELDATQYINRLRVKEKKLQSELAAVQKDMRKMSRLRTKLRKGIQALILLADQPKKMP